MQTDDSRTDVIIEDGSNYTPVQNTILLKANVRLTAVQLMGCTTAGDILNAADREMVKTFIPHIDFQVVEISDEFKRLQPDVKKGDYVDIKSVGMVLFRPQVKGLNPMQYLKDIKEQYADLFAGVNASKSKSSVVFNPNAPIKKSNIKGTDVITVQFYCVTEFHNISGTYKPTYKVVVNDNKA